MKKLRSLIEFQEKIAAEIGKEKMEITLYQVDSDLEAEVKAICAEPNLNTAVQVQEKHAREDAISEVKKQVIAKYEEQEADEDKLKQVKQILDKLVKDEVRRLITEEKVRPDGRIILMKFVHCLQKSAYYHVHMVQDCLHADKLKPLVFVH